MADIAQLGIEIDTRQLKTGEKALSSFSSAAQKTESSVSVATKAITAMGAALAANSLIKAADSFSMMNARVSRFTSTAQEASDVMRQLTTFANAAGSEVRDSVSVFTSLSGALQDVGASQADVLQLTKTLNQLGVIGGSSSEEVSNALRQFSQSMAGGIVRAEEFNSIIENTPEIARAIGAGMNLSMGQLRAAMLNGQLTADAVMKSLLGQTDSVNAAFAKMPRTVSAALQSLSNEFSGLVGEMNGTTGATGSLAGAIDGVSGVIVSLRENISTVVQVGEVMAVLYGARMVGSIASSQVAMSALTGVISLYNIATSPTIVKTDALGMAITTTTRAAQIGSVAMSGLRGAMALLGGPAGVIMLAATAIYYFYQKSQEAAQQALEFASSVDTTTQALRSMTPVAAAAANAKLAVALQEQEESAADLRDELQALEDKYRSGTSASGNYQLSQSQLVDLQNQIAIKAGEVEEAENKVSQTRSKQQALTASLNGTLRENYVEQQNNNSVTGIAVGIQNQLNAALGIGNARLATRTEYVTNLSGKSSISDAVKGEVAAINAEAAALSITDLRAREAALTRIEYAKDTKKTADEVNLLVDAHMKVWDQEQKNTASTKSLSSAAKDAASAAKKHAEEVERQKQSITDLNQQLEIAKTEAASGGRAAVELTAKYEAQRQGMGKLTDQYISAKLALYDFQQQQNTNTQFDQYLDNQTASLLKLKAAAQTQLSGPKKQIVVSGIDKKLQEQTFANLPTIDGGAQSNEQNQIAQLQTQTTAMNDAYNQRIEDYKLYRASEVENAAYYDSQIQALEDKRKANNAAAQSAMLNLQLSAGESMAASAADSFKSILGEQSAAYQTMFAVQKAFSIAQSMIAIQTGIAQAAALPFPANLGAMATVAAATANIVSSIMSIASPSFDGGGYTGNGSRTGGLDGKGGFWAIMHPQETVIDHTKSGSSAITGSSSGGNITVNVSLQETSDASQQGTTQQSTNDDGSVQINVFVADIRSEGSMAQVLERTYGLSRVGA